VGYADLLLLPIADDEDGGGGGGGFDPPIDRGWVWRDGCQQEWRDLSNGVWREE